MKNRIGVIGAGVMGRGVAERFVKYGFEITLYDIKDEILSQAVKEILRNVKLSAMFQKNIDMKKVMGNISTTTSYTDLKQADYIIENVPEIFEVKEQVYKELNHYCKDNCIYMVNTSCIPITSVGRIMKHPEQVIGVHFMNPVPMKNFAEVIQGYYTSENTILMVNELLKKVGIEMEVVNDSPGFVSNRVSHIFMNEAINLVYEGIATAEQIDHIFTKGFGHKMGPLATADLIGLDTVMESLKILYEEYEDSKYRVSPLLKKMVNAGLLGVKSKKGFFDYS